MHLHLHMGYTARQSHGYGLPASSVIQGKQENILVIKTEQRLGYFPLLAGMWLGCSAVGDTQTPAHHGQHSTAEPEFLSANIICN